MKMHNRNSKKFLAALLSLVMIFSTASVCFTAFAAEKTVYTVKSTSPAIPMNANTFISTDSLEFVNNQGTTISGTNATVKLLNSADKRKIEIGEDYILAYETGIYPAQVSDGVNTMNVYIVVKNLNENTWYLYNEDFTGSDWSNGGTFPKDWSSYYLVGGQYTNIPSAQAYSCGISGGESYYPTSGILPIYNVKKDGVRAFFILNNEVVNAFTDYTITADLWTKTAQAYDQNAGPGLFGRAALGTDGTPTNAFKAYNAATRNTGIYVTEVSITGATPTASSIIATAWDGMPTTVQLAKPENIVYTLTYDGAKATFGSPTAPNASFERDVTESNGSVGVFINGAGKSDTEFASYATVNSFSVALNNEADECPPRYYRWCGRLHC